VPTGNWLRKGSIESGMIFEGVTSFHCSRPCTSARDSAEKLEEIGPAE